MSIVVKGQIVTGIGVGSRFIGMEWVREQILEKLGFDPYPGTLNLRLTSEYDVRARNEIEECPAVEIEGFHNENRSFGSVRCYPAIIDNRAKGALITALRRHYDISVLEIIASVALRNHLGIRDGCKVKIEVLTLP